ncbi:phage tail assembly protein [Brucella sp. 10RB9213]|uniref:phage tail assembly protein n=1 Tax=Brucella sp. 10RB9213 TaxID=1844039 RepID=UPI0012AE1A22|nr:phage tail assembly protein [Brucella sp. 10RB9213]MRN66536.1 phage tail assembly protein [Brucella sp. 10RB9213]
MSKTITVQLSTPINHDGKQISSITFKEPTARDACNADLVEGDFKKMLAIISGMAGLPLPILQDLPMREFNRIVKEVAPLMGE